MTPRAAFTIFRASTQQHQKCWEIHSFLSPYQTERCPSGELKVLQSLPVTSCTILHLEATAKIQLVLSLPLVKLAVVAAVSGNAREWKDALIGCLRVVVLHWYSAHRKCWVQGFFQPLSAYFLQISSLPVRAVNCTATKSSINICFFKETLPFFPLVLVILIAPIHCVLLLCSSHAFQKQQGGAPE